MTHCEDTDCAFYETDFCNDCYICTFCGAVIDRRNRHKAHVYRAQSRGGRTWVPACMACNLSQGTKGLVTWIRWLHENDPELYDKIVDWQADKETDWLFRRDKIAQMILAIHNEDYSWVARLKEWFKS